MLTSNLATLLCDSLPRFSCEHSSGWQILTTTHFIRTFYLSNGLMTLVALTLQPQVLAMHLCKNCAQKPRQNNHHNTRHSQVVLFLWMRVFNSGISVVGFICSSPPPPPEGRQGTCDTLKKCNRKMLWLGDTTEPSLVGKLAMMRIAAMMRVCCIARE